MRGETHELSAVQEAARSLLASSPSQIVYQPHPFSSAFETAVAVEGRSVQQLVDSLNFNEVYEGHVHVWIGDREVDRQHWHLVRPRDGQVIYVRVVPHGGGGGGGKNLLRAIAFVVVAIAAVYTGGAAAAAMGFTEVTAAGATVLTTTGMVVAAGVSVGVSMIGNALVNALIPPPKPSFDVNSSADASPVAAPRYQLTGVQNRLAPYANIPRVFGKRRMYPLLAAQPYSEIQGSDEYLRIALLVGWGPIRISDIKIGDTPLSAFQGVEVETREGWDNDQPLTLFTQSVQQQNFQVTLEQDVWNQRTTESNVTEVSVDLSFPAGLAYFNDAGGRDPITVNFEVQYAVAGSNSWVNPTWTNASDDGFGTAGAISVTAADSSALRKSGRFAVPKGQYDVRIRRTTAKFGSRYSDGSYWTVLRYVIDSQPIVQENVALIAMRIKATGQLNGVPSSINCIAESYLPVHDGSSWSWQISRNPAWAFADLLRRRNGDPYLADSRIDLPALRSWAAACDATAPNDPAPYWRFDAVIEGGSIFQNLKLIASHCRANYTVRDGKHSVVRDVAQNVPVQHITPRNSFGYVGHKTFVEYPHAIRVKFVNQDNGWQEDEAIVYADGYNKYNATVFESLDLPGCVSYQQAWREGRYQHAVGRLRPEEHVVTMDIEALRCTLGDYVLFSHDVISVGIASTRIKSLTRNTNGAVTAIVLDDEVLFDEGVVRSYVLRVRRSDGSSQLVSLVSVGIGYSDTVMPLVPIASNTAPAVGDLVVFGEANRETAPMLVRRIDPGPNLTVRLSLVDAQPGVWTADTQAIPAFNSYITVTTQPAEAKPGLAGIQNIRSDESVLLRLADGTLQDRIAVEILPPVSGIVRTASYEVQYRQQGAVNWIAAPRVTIDAPTLYISGVQAERYYELRVRAISAASIAGDWSSVVTHKVIGKTTPPSEPGSFTATPRVDGVQLNWTAAPDIDVVGYNIRRGTDWATATVVTEKYSGLSLFVGLTSAAAETFLIRSIDAVGLESLQVLVASAAPAAPANVPKFSVYAREDYVACSWTPVEGVGIQYEVRSGESWPTGVVIGRTAGDKLEVKYPVRTAGDVTYWIKALSPAGLYSQAAIFASTRQAPIANRNVVLANDWTALNYPGVKLDLQQNASALELTKVNGRNSQRGDYYAEITLPATYYARSWTEVSSASVSNSGATWAASQYSWDNAGSLTWQGALGDTDAGVSTAYISPYIGTLPSGVIEGWRLSENATGVSGTTAAVSQDLTFSPCHFANGLETLGSTQAAWDVAIPSVFSTVFDFRADTFLDADQCLLTLRAGSGYLRLIYDSLIDKFSLVDHLGNRIDITVPTESGDVVTFGISQSLTSRALYAATRRYPNPVTGELTVAPIGNFTQIALTA